MAFMTGKWTTSPDTIERKIAVPDPFKEMVAQKTIDSLVTVLAERTPPQVETVKVETTLYQDTGSTKTVTITLKETPRETWMAKSQWKDIVAVKIQAKFPEKLITTEWNQLRDIWTSEDKWYAELQASLIDDLSLKIAHKVKDNWYGLGISTDKEILISVGKSF